MPCGVSYRGGNEKEDRVMTTYRTKVDVWLLLLIFIPLGYPLVETIIEGEWIVMAVLLVSIAFVFYLIFAIKYVINGDMLEIKNGFMGTTKIAIADIKSVEKTNNPLSAPAMSLKRLEIKYGNKFDSALISPVDREAFINDLLRLNPDIRVSA